MGRACRYCAAVSPVSRVVSFIILLRPAEPLAERGLLSRPLFPPAGSP
ncbi:hypothetical protein dsx2_1338 [Desulfovibrio sp. X2]|nr:hypothetical protein [Desulfovibrio sp. X2]EPR44710.1 hypothetical protein dsx2_1338 [Desulfovibrio sp. X2]